VARGISAFDDYRLKVFPGPRYRYGCPYCDFTTTLGPMGNAFRRIARGKSTIRHHIIDKHPEATATWKRPTRREEVL